MVTSLLLIGNETVWNGGADVETGRAATAADALVSLSRRAWDVVLVGRVSDSTTESLLANLSRRYPAIPVIVELGIALSAFSAVAGMIVLCRFPMLYHPVLKSDRIISALDDKYLIVIEARDPMYSPTQTKALLQKMGGHDVKEMEA